MKAAPDKYCERCGKLLTKRTYWTKRYNKKTGEKIYDDAYECWNPECVDGCENSGGHKYPSLWDQMIKFKSSDLCIRCNTYWYQRY